jgi:UDP:flavonoid glycosyltransferase YjiC (YdhE family)
VDFVPHRAVLPHASLMVSHAGWQTINASLADGVPLLCIPDGRDQPDNALRVVSAGAGMRIPKRSSPRRIRRAIVQALADPAMREAAGRMAQALARSDGACAVADGLEELTQLRTRSAAASLNLPPGRAVVACARPRPRSP